MSSSIYDDWDSMDESVKNRKKRAEEKAKLYEGLGDSLEQTAAAVATGGMNGGLSGAMSGFVQSGIGIGDGNKLIDIYNKKYVEGSYPASTDSDSSPSVEVEGLASENSGDDSEDELKKRIKLMMGGWNGAL